MKILHVISDENIGGAGVLLLNLLSCFDRREVESYVALPDRSALRARVEEIGIPTVPLRYSCDGFSAAAVRELVRSIKNNRVDAVHANAALAARIAGRISGVRVIHTRHCCFPPSGILRFPLVRFLGGIFNRLLSDCVIATADAAKENLEQLGIPADKIRVIINGSHPIREVGEAEINAIRKRLGISPLDFVVGICARLEQCKGHKTFLDAARLALHRSPWISFRFLIIGDGTLRRELECYAKHLGIFENVTFLGFVEDPAPYYRLMRVNVNCSVGTETSCLALSEGMSASLPTVATEYGGNRAMLGDGKAGILIAMNDSEGLAQALCKIAEDPFLEKRMRILARERYETYYTAERMAHEVTDLYRSVLK